MDRLYQLLDDMENPGINRSLFACIRCRISCFHRILIAVSRVRAIILLTGELIRILWWSSYPSSWWMSPTNCFWLFRKSSNTDLGKSLELGSKTLNVLYFFWFSGSTAFRIILLPISVQPGIFAQKEVCSWLFLISSKILKYCLFVTVRWSMHSAILHDFESGLQLSCSRLRS